MIKFLRIITAFALLATAANALHAQTREQTADLFADVELIKQEVGQLRLQVQNVRHENEALQKNMARLLDNQEGMRKEYLKLVALSEANLDTMRIELAKANLKNHKDIIDAVSKQIEKFSKQIQGAKAPAAPSTGADSEKKYTFPNNFPENGIAYTIQNGDTLTKIARMHGSKIQWIQNANRITNPRNLKLGTKLFIPQK